MIIAGTTVALAVDADGPLIGIMLRGDVGVGKTAAALDLIDACPFRRTGLVADDQTEIFAAGQTINAAAPSSIAGQAEMRGAGVIRLRSIAPCPLRFVIVHDTSARLMPLAALAPFGPERPQLPQVRVHHFMGLRSLVRSLLAGHSLRGDVE